MSKSARNRADNAEKKRLKAEREAFAAKQAKVHKITAIVTTALIGVAAVAIIAGSIVSSVRLNTGSYLRSKPVAGSPNLEVNGTMMTYFYNDVYNSFVDYYGSYVSYYGLDTTYSAKAQEMSDGVSWFAYFMEGAQNNVTGILALNEAANAEGFEVSEAERTALEKRVERIDPGLYGRGVKREDILNAKNLELTAYKYQFAKQDELTPSESEIAARYESDAKKYQSVDYLAYEVSLTSGAYTATEADDAAARLEAASSPDEFKAIIRELLAFEYPDMTDEELDEEVEYYLTEGTLYSEGESFSEWAFGGAKVGDTFRDSDSSALRVYMLTSEPARDESKTVTVRHILFSSDNYGSAEAARAKAEEVLAGFGTGEISEHVFGCEALAWSEDEGSYYNGGLIEEIVEGTMLTEFNDWCFDSARFDGEVTVLETSLGAHIMYFVGEGREAWQASVSEDIISERFSELNSELLEKYPVEFDLPLLEEIPG